MTTTEPDSPPSPLSEMEDILMEEDFQTLYQPVDEENFYEKLHVSLGEDEKGRQFNIQLHFINDVSRAQGGEDEPEDIVLLQMFLLLPYSITDATFMPTARLILMLNRILPLGAFGISEVDGAMYYQNNAGLTDRAMDPDVLVESMRIIGFFVTRFTDLLEEVATGARTFEAAAQALFDQGIQVPPLTGLPPPFKAEE